MVSIGSGSYGADSGKSFLRSVRKSRRTAQGGRNWTELPDDITASILSRLKTVEILRTAQRVCMTWRRICKENSLVWQSIDILDERYINLNYDMDKVCRHVIDLSSGNLVDISIEYIGTDQLLKYLAERPRKSTVSPKERRHKLRWLTWRAFTIFQPNKSRTTPSRAEPEPSSPEKKKITGPSPGPLDSGDYAILTHTPITPFVDLTGILFRI
ncbi:hypothetical protein ACLB2K_023802 [Fragaria x ananassa]